MRDVHAERIVAPVPRTSIFFLCRPALEIASDPGPFPSLVDVAGAQGQVRARVPRVRVPPRRQTPVRQQHQLQEGLAHPPRDVRERDGDEEVKRIVADSQILREDDREWPEGDKVGSQELEIVLGEDLCRFTTAKIGSLLDVQSSKDPEGMAMLLLPRAGPQVHGVLLDQPAHEDQAHLSQRRRCDARGGGSAGDGVG